MKKACLLTAAAGLVVSGLGMGTADAAGTPSWAKKGTKIVKCRGIAKAKMNDCGANGHSCENQAVKDGDKKEWVYVPEGVCEKIVGGVAWKSKDVK
ncbi:MAG: DUF2282 domain-containing protein [Bdellovibrionales bacterium]